MEEVVQPNKDHHHNLDALHLYNPRMEQNCSDNLANQLKEVLTGKQIDYDKSLVETLVNNTELSIHLFNKLEALKDTLLPTS